MAARPGEAADKALIIDGGSLKESSTEQLLVSKKALQSPVNAGLSISMTWLGLGNVPVQLSFMCTAGSILEGGGQILRNAAALAAITSTPIRVSKIRAGRSKPGLRAQHLAGLQLVTDLCQGHLDGGTIGSQEISLTPHHISSGHHIGDTKTAGSCMLLAQVQLVHSLNLLLQHWVVYGPISMRLKVQALPWP